MSTSLESYCYELPRRVTLALIAPLLLVPLGFDLPPAEAQTSDPVADACDEYHPCDARKGDCDSNTECYLGLVCAADVGSGLGYERDVDVCWIGPAGGKDSCTTANPCWAGMGDCKNDSHCDSGMHCVNAAGKPFGWGNDVGVCMPHRWEIKKGQELPTGAVRAGTEDGSPLYVCRAKRNGYHIGKMVSNECHFGFGNKAIFAKNFEVMVYTGVDFGSQYDWVKPDKPLPNQAVKGGYESKRDFYVCRAKYHDVLHPGKLVADKCHITYGKDAIQSADYEVLVLRRASH